MKRSLLSMNDLDRQDILTILDTAGSMHDVQHREVKKLPTLRGRTVVNLFFESSTRTASSFELAAKRLSADTMTIRAAGSSVDKGMAMIGPALTVCLGGMMAFIMWAVLGPVYDILGKIKF